jgi:hypothetical protein
MDDEHAASWRDQVRREKMCDMTALSQSVSAAGRSRRFCAAPGTLDPIYRKERDCERISTHGIARKMSRHLEDEVNRHTEELVRLTLKAADQGPEPLPEEEVAELGRVIAVERQLLIDAMSALLQEDEPDATAPGVAEFDAGFVYGLAFARAIEDARTALDRLQRGRILRLAKGQDADA